MNKATSFVGKIMGKMRGICFYDFAPNDFAKQKM
jgi:hypothetical protein